MTTNPQGEEDKFCSCDYPCSMGQGENEVCSGCAGLVNRPEKGEEGNFFRPYQCDDGDWVVLCCGFGQLMDGTKEQAEAHASDMEKALIERLSSRGWVGPEHLASIVNGNMDAQRRLSEEIEIRKLKTEKAWESSDTYRNLLVVAEKELSSLKERAEGLVELAARICERRDGAWVTETVDQKAKEIRGLCGV